MPRLALVLGAGGTVGHAFHAGVLSALYDWGLDARQIDLLIGTSVGAVTSGLLRAGVPATDLFADATGGEFSDEGARILDRAGGFPEFPQRPDGVEWLEPASPELFWAIIRHPRQFRPGLLLSALAPAGSVETGPMEKAFLDMGGESWPSRDTWICAADYATGERKVFGLGTEESTPFPTAIAASIAVPGFFQPVVIDGRRYVDGGLHSPSNTDLLEGIDDLDAIIASVPMGIGGLPGRLGIDLPGRLLNHLAAYGPLSSFSQNDTKIALLEPSQPELEVMHYDSFAHDQLSEIAGRARRTTSDRISVGDLGWIADLGQDALPQAAGGGGSGTGGAVPT